MIKYIIALMLLGLALSSYADSPTGGASGKSGCYTVSGEIYQTSIAPAPLAGTISGDVEGTVVTLGGPNVFHGAVMFGPIVQTWEVTGGIVEPLIGTTVVFEVDFMGILAQFPILSINNTARVVEGAEKGSLTLHGWTDLTNAPASFVNYLEYHGVICP